MTKTTIIPAGYRLTVTSWENDADNYNTEVKEGLSLEKCRIYVDLCKLMHPDSEHANLYEPDEDELQALGAAYMEIALRHPDKAHEIEHLTDADLVQDVLQDICYDLGLGGGDFHTRVCSEWKVEYIPEPIVLTDVTEEFM